MGKDTYHILKFNKSKDCFEQIKTPLHKKMKIVEYTHRSSAYAYMDKLKERFPNERFIITRHKNKCVVCGFNRVIHDFMGYCNQCNIKIKSKIEVH